MQLRNIMGQVLEIAQLHKNKYFYLTFVQSSTLWSYAHRVYAYDQNVEVSVPPETHQVFSWGCKFTIYGLAHDAS